VTQHLEHGRGLSELAAESGISLRCAYRWLARYRSVDPQQLQQAVDLHHQRLHLRHIARLLQAPFSTVARTLSRLGLGRLRNLESRPPVQRYEWERPGDLIHIDVKTLARFARWGTGSPAIANRAAPTASVTTRFTSPSTTPPGWRLSRF
jgi:transposase-like protein